MTIKYVWRLKSIWVFLRSAHVFYSNGQLPIHPAKNQVVIHLDHGIAFKSYVQASYSTKNSENFFNYFMVPSDIYIPVIQDAYKCNKENIYICGELVTDVFFDKIQKNYDFGEYDKLILWAPTFKQSDDLGQSDSYEKLVPLFDESEYSKLNDILKKYNYKLIVKLHIAQNCGNCFNTKYSNLKLYTNDEFTKSGMDLYVLMKQSDFLLADYSSVFLQYLLLDKPMAFVIPDFDEYNDKRGFVFENPLDFMPGDKIKTKEDLFKCFEDLHNGIDKYFVERKRVKDLIHKYQNGHNFERIIKLSNIKH